MVRTSRCGRDNPGSTPGVVRFLNIPEEVQIRALSRFERKKVMAKVEASFICRSPVFELSSHGKSFARFGDLVFFVIILIQ